MSREVHYPCRLCDKPRVLVDDVFCSSCYDLIEHIKAYYDYYNSRMEKINGLRRIYERRA